MLPTQATPKLIRVIRALRALLHFLWGAFCTTLILPLLNDSARWRIRARWAHQLLCILSMRVESNAAAAMPGCLIVANHISWADIFAINAVRPATFISKAEVRRWPLAGWLAEKNGTIFLRRGSRGHARIVNAEIDARLNNGKDIAIFPEGTTTDGTHVLGFHAALLQPAIETGRPVLPLAISYHLPEGERCLAPSYAGDTTMSQSLSAVLSCREIIVRVQSGDPIYPDGMTRRELADAAHAAIVTRLESLPANSAPG